MKLLDVASDDPNARERFLREALIGGRINHPNAVTVFDTGDDDGTLYITMELIDGEDLARRLRRMGPLPPAEAVAVAAQVLGVLEVAHENGIIHRDIKSSNILLEPDGTARLADFGIAQPLGELSSQLTGTGQIIGTAKYLSPEQASGEVLTSATDLYSTGVVLYEMLAGDVPFGGDHPVAIALAHQQQELPPLRARASHVDPQLAAVVERSLRKDPAARYPSAASMRSALSDPSSSTAALDADTGTTTAVVQAHGGGSGTSRLPVPNAGAKPRPAARSWFHRRSRLAVALVGGVIAALIAVAVSIDNGSRAPNHVATGAETTPTSAKPPAEQPTTPTTTREAPTTPTLGELTDRVAADPDAYGDKGSDLLNALQEVQREKPDKQAKKATRVLEEIDKWVAEGKLDATIADQARAVLRPIANP